MTAISCLYFVYKKRRRRRYTKQKTASSRVTSVMKSNSRYVSLSLAVCLNYLLLLLVWFVVSSPFTYLLLFFGKLTHASTRRIHKIEHLSIVISLSFNMLSIYVPRATVIVFIRSRTISFHVQINLDLLTLFEKFFWNVNKYLSFFFLIFSFAAVAISVSNSAFHLKYKSI